MSPVLWASLGALALALGFRSVFRSGRKLGFREGYRRQIAGSSGAGQPWVDLMDASDHLVGNGSWEYPIAGTFVRVPLDRMEQLHAAVRKVRP